jgi:hypothetical protein
VLMVLFPADSESSDSASANVSPAPVRKQQGSSKTADKADVSLSVDASRAPVGKPFEVHFRTDVPVARLTAQLVSLGTPDAASTCIVRGGTKPGTVFVSVSLSTPGAKYSLQLCRDKEPFASVSLRAKKKAKPKQKKEGKSFISTQ